MHLPVLFDDWCKMVSKLPSSAKVVIAKGYVQHVLSNRQSLTLIVNYYNNAAFLRQSNHIGDMINFIRDDISYFLRSSRLASW